ncbi:MAG TPA: hypothetical protein VKV79_06350 [Terriglobia bacterium]|nr:hypothetical protein [Terriglobia bacterium]
MNDKRVHDYSPPVPHPNGCTDFQRQYVQAVCDILIVTDKVAQLKDEDVVSCLSGWGWQGRNSAPKIAASGCM